MGIRNPSFALIAAAHLWGIIDTSLSKIIDACMLMRFLIFSVAPQQSQIEIFLPFKSTILDKNYEKIVKGQDQPIVIKDQLEDLFNYFNSCSIRNKVIYYNNQR